ncbi:TetR/AcrR family transcriptional regulator [Sphingosinicella sp. BN140058]|uniref:TetR/AcrR family transcriptional regulator n=1 Tax=Sphingosinicella sp. BN140058 TaxID=1892855 RepID=UPI001013218C|nr:TetR/AcrR family transcriptional regulator [Sphingosinicella sp. BN140058]QAY76533.1 TetR/AcrR family transcriptional regulator [Sphingosinicella sp. BN140058]
MATLPTPSGKRAARREDMRSRIEAALLDGFASGEPARLGHDALAEAAGVSRRTVYRYFPDKDALMKALWNRLASAIAPAAWPESGPDVLARLPGLFAGFDANAPTMIVAMASAQGRAMRNAMTSERSTAWRAALAKETEALAEPDRTMAIAVIQYLGAGFAWSEMRDQWGLDGAASAAACGWAIRTLLKDLASRGERPLAHAD